MFDKNSLVQTLKELPFSKKEYWVITGGAMVLYGFRPQTNDIDLGCTTSLANKLEEEGYPTSYSNDGTRKILYSSNVEFYENRIEGTIEIVDDIPTLSVDGLLQMKKKIGREKDLIDIALIEKAQKNNL